MKRFLTAILTIFLTLFLIVFGAIISAKDILVNTTEVLIKNEIKTNFISTIEDYTETKIPDETIEKIEKEIENNQTIKKLIDDNYDEIINVLSNKDAKVDIKVSDYLNEFIENNEQILKDNNIVITEEAKKEIIAIADSEEVNSLINDTVLEIRNDLDERVFTVVSAYSFITSSTFKLIMIAIIIFDLVLIALLKKSTYKWLSNLATASIITGLLLGVLFPILVDKLLVLLELSDKISISINALKYYGLVTSIIGIVSIIVNVVITKLNKKEIQE